jgi:hypothetical protein
VTGLDALADLEFAIDLFDMGFDGIDGDHQFACDLSIGAASAHTPQHPLFLLTQWFDE